MIGRTLRLVVALLVLAGGLFVGARSIGPAPALGPFLEPAHGVWSLARAATMPARAQARIPGLRDSVQVVYDDRAVPHVFATQRRGRLPRARLRRRARPAVPAVRADARRVGAAHRDRRRRDAPARSRDAPARAAARRGARDGSASSDTSTMGRVARAYADGINAYIASMPASALPLEFRLLGVRPPEWKPIDTYYLQNADGVDAREHRERAGSRRRRRARGARGGASRSSPTTRRSRSRSSRTASTRRGSTSTASAAGRAGQREHARRRGGRRVRSVATVRRARAG